MADGRPDSIGDVPARPAPVDHVQIGGVTLDVLDFEAFDQADARREASFVTNFGNWTLPPDLAAALDAPRARLEWIHNTGELVVLGGVPHVGAAAVDVPATAGNLATGLPAAFGGTAAIGRSDTAGMVRMSFQEEVLPPGSRAVVLGRIQHGPRVHELLWGWHEHHHRRDGWTWLVERLRHFNEPAGDDTRLL